MKRIRRLALFVIVAIVILAAGTWWMDRRRGGGTGRREEGTFRGIPYVLYVPSGHEGRPLPLVLGLHGCGGSPRTFARSTRWNALADREGFLVLYPEEIASHHEDLCWRWFAPGDQRRGEGEPALLVALIDQVAKKARVDPKRVYATGHSSGGAMSAILGACYPDVFAAVGIHSGEEYIRGLSREDAKAVPGQGGPDPDRQGVLAHECAGDAARPIPAMVIHGLADPLAKPVNGDQAYRQFVQTNDLADDGRDDGSVAVAQARRSKVGGASVETIWRDGAPLVRYLRVPGLGHDWSGSAVDGTGGMPDATRMLWRFFRSHSR